MNTERSTLIELAIKAGGGPTAVATSLGIKAPSLYSWIERGEVPPGRCIEVERLTGVSRHVLNPKVFGPAPSNEPSGEAPTERAEAA